MISSEQAKGTVIDAEPLESTAQTDSKAFVELQNPIRGLLASLERSKNTDELTYHAGQIKA